MKPARAAAVALLFVLTVLASPGCKGRSSLDGASLRTSEVPAEGPVQGRATLGSPIRIGDSSTALVPFGFGRPKTFLDKFRLPSASTLGELFFGPPVPGSRNAFAGPAPQEVFWLNAIFADPLTGRADPLLTHRGVIVQALLVDQEQAPLAGQGLWAFTVVSRDTNRDGWLRGDDTGLVILTSPTGEWARRATPEEGQQLVSISQQPGTSLLLFRLRRDADGDGKYTTRDPVEPWVVDPVGGAPGTRLVPVPLLDRLEHVAR